MSATIGVLPTVSAMFVGIRGMRRLRTLPATPERGGPVRGGSDQVAVVALAAAPDDRGDRRAVLEDPAGAAGGAEGRREAQPAHEGVLDGGARVERGRHREGPVGPGVAFVQHGGQNARGPGILRFMRTLDE